MTEYVVDTYAEAVAVATALSQPGDELEVHAIECPVDERLEGCTCTPVIMVVGEKASA